ncbi:hypothetical protein ABD70_17650 [Alkalihalobacillus lehensis]|nr:hypothetical protein [Shouchella lehensis]
MSKKRWNEAVREQREGPAPEPEVRMRHGRCECGAGKFKLSVHKGKWTQTCKECGEERAR